jgi:formylglycine-generating enzyme required for sulfatase activity
MFGVLLWALLGVQDPPPRAIEEVASKRDCADCPEIVRVMQPPKPVGRSTPITYAFKYEATWAEYLRAVNEGGCTPPKLNFGKLADPADRSLYDRTAVTGVSIDDARCFAAWLSAKSGKKYRLPTAAEWEALARAGATTDYPWGNQLGMNNAFVHDAYEPSRYPIINFLGPRSPSNIHPVGQFRPNANGMYDVIGNAWELTSTTAPGTGPCKPALGCERVKLMGLTFRNSSRFSDEGWTYSNVRDAGVGFRLVRE